MWLGGWLGGCYWVGWSLWDLVYTLQLVCCVGYGWDGLGWVGMGWDRREDGLGWVVTNVYKHTYVACVSLREVGGKISLIHRYEKLPYLIQIAYRHS